MAELMSPDKSLLTRVIATEVQGAYAFEVRNIQNENILAEQIISPLLATMRTLCR